MFNKQRKDGAVTPDRSAVTRVLRELKKASQKKTDKIDSRDSALHELAEMPGWKILKKYIAKEIDSLRSLANVETEGRGLEEIGLRFVISNLAAEKLTKIITLVERSAEVVEEIRREEGGESA